MQTTTKIFSILMAAGLLAGIGFITLAKSLSQSFKAFGSKPIVLSIVTALLAVGALYLSSALITDEFALYWAMSAVFLLFGSLHTAVSKNKFVFAQPSEKPKVMLAECLYTLAMMLLVAVGFSAVQYFLVSPYFLFYPLLLSALFFTVPFLIYLSYLFVISIPHPVYASWQYPVHAPLDPPEDNPNERLLVIGFEIPKNLSSKTKTYFRAKTPEGINLGELFYHFVNDYNEVQSETPIQVVSEEGTPLTWYMRLKPRLFRWGKVLNPNITVRENGIRENAVIVCEHYLNEPEMENA
jgi:hypothetical protein